MPRSQPCYLKRRNVIYTSKTSFLERLKEIRDAHTQNDRCYITKPDYISDLKDFLEDFYCDSERIFAIHNIDDCQFFVEKSPDHRTHCVYIESNGRSDDFSTSTNGFNPPSEKAKFSQACAFILIPLKQERKREKLQEQGLLGNLNDYELIHKLPVWGEIIDQFIEKYHLAKKLNEVISDNMQGNNAPVFKDEYKTLNSEFMQFYCELSLEYELIPAK